MNVAHVHFKISEDQKARAEAAARSTGTTLSGWIRWIVRAAADKELPNTQRLGGGVEPMLGDFYTMDQDIKCITVMGGTQIDGRSTVASKGTGSA